MEGIDQGADVYLTKPFSPKELVLRIKKLIELRQLLRKRYRDSELPKANDTFQKEDEFINSLNAYITDRLSDPDLNVDAIARHFSMSRMQLYRKFNALADTTVNNYIQSVRMEKAIQLLKEQNLNITEVAYATGFSSVSYFSKTFKKMYGKSPSEAL